MAVVGNRVIGHGSAAPSGVATDALVQLSGHVRNGKLKAVLTLVFDPLDRVKPGTQAGTVSAHVGKTSVKGKLIATGVPGTKPGTEGLIQADLLEEDVPAMREIAGVYGGSVAGGVPEFSAKANLGANGTFTLEEIRRPDKSLVPGRIGGVYMLGKPFNPGQFDRLVYALPLPYTTGSSGVQGVYAPFLCDCCDTSTEQGQEDQNHAKEASQEATAKASARKGQVRAGYWRD